MTHVPCGLATNPAPPSGLVDRLIDLADACVASGPAAREVRGLRAVLDAVEHGAVYVTVTY
ncbi:hypothetical protein ACFY40_29540 [Streptomyces sp. NPDC012950]|uniref:hypothetical protein n=1 Tax=Streptomyces sp. NPDC012950 TaxID=3364858 RepID=UPI0036CD42A9